MKSNIIILFILIFLVSACGNNSENKVSKDSTTQNKTEQAQKRTDIKFIASSERIVEQGEIFLLKYSINEKVNSFTPLNFKDFDIISGPSTSQSQSFQIINGKSSRNISIIYTYNILANKAGSFTLPPAEVIINGQTYKCNSLNIKVIGDGQPASNNNSNKNKNINTNKDVFLKTHYSKTKIYKGEHIIATTKIYTRKDFQNISELKFPDYKEFWSEVLKAPRQIDFKNEEINGKVYNVALLKQVLLYSQKPGKFTISPYTIELQIKKKDGKAKDFFGRIVDHYKLINKKISTKKQVITVLPLPRPIPKNFSGITGKNIIIENAINNTNIKTDESTNLQIKVSGNGNLYLLNDLKLQLPKGIEHFKPEVEKNEKYTENGAYVEKFFNYIIVGNDVGTFNLPAFSFIYFNTNTEEYETAYGTALNLNVGKGDAYVPSKNNDENNNEKDIRYIKTNNLSLHKKGESFAGSLLFYLIIASLIFAYSILLIIRKKNIEKNKDTVKVKKKNASKVSQRRLKTANKFMLENNNQAFYKEILTSIWGYLSDKLSANSDELTNQNIKSLLENKNTDNSTIKELLEIIELCGYAQYSPDKNSKPENIYKKTENIINKLEEYL